MDVLKRVGLKFIRWGIFFSFLATSFSIILAADKTPPYAGWKPPEPFQPFKSALPVKQVPKEPATAKKPVKGSVEQTPVVAEHYRPQEYVVREGDWIAKILREKGVLKENNLQTLLKILQKLNRSMTDFNLIKPGEKIVILVKVDSGAKTEKPSAPKKKVEPGKKIVPEKPPAAEKPAPLQIRRVIIARPKVISTIQQLKSEPYPIQQGDILSMVVMNRYDLTLRTFINEYLDLFKKCNPSINNPNRLFPGQTVNLPLYPPQWYAESAPRVAQSPIMRDLADSNKVRLPNPTPIDETEETPMVALRRKHEATQKTWFSKKAAGAKIPKQPEIQKVIPQSPPAQTKKPAPSLSVPSRPETTYRTALWQVQQSNSSVSEGLGEILPQMGEHWVQSGKHFIPMKSGGHITLKADTYPIVKGPDGTTLIVDLYNSLPPRMGRVIESSWGNYRIVHLSPTDDLQSAFSKILKAFQYPKVFKKREPLKLTGDIPVSITGDWIVIPPENNSGKRPKFIVINLLDDRGKSVPPSVRAYLNGLGVRFVEYPPSPKPPKKPQIEKVPETAVDAPSLVEMILTLTGHPHSARVKIPAFESGNDDFKLTVTADFYLTAHGRKRVIDLSGFDPEIVALLKDRGIAVLSLSKEANPLSLASKTLKFLGWPYKKGPHALSTAPNSRHNVKLTLNGLIFSTERGHSVFMTPLDLPPEVALFLYDKGYRVVSLASFSPGAKTQTTRGG